MTAAAIAIAFESPAAFDAVSIKPSRLATTNSLSRFEPGRFSATNLPLKALIQVAWGVKDFELSGASGWIESVPWDVTARWSGNPNLPQSDVKPMIQKMLMDRFQLQTHRETKEAPIYSLVPAKNGPKLKPTAGGPGPAWGLGPGHLDAKVVSLSLFASALEQQLDRPVRDNTAIAGNYDIKLEWAKDASDTTAPSLFTAIQEQLGLRLESARGPVSMLVIDSAAHPSPN
ncbi:MAG TPA: TIGR03435 family protein [Bryobacteraceae bacterium]|nr:TIGR03435 family protein [Bryobacteraceae bacterium]